MSELIILAKLPNGLKHKDPFNPREWGAEENELGEFKLFEHIKIQEGENDMFLISVEYQSAVDDTSWTWPQDYQIRNNIQASFILQSLLKKEFYDDSMRYFNKSA